MHGHWSAESSQTLRAKPSTTVMHAVEADAPGWGMTLRRNGGRKCFAPRIAAPLPQDPSGDECRSAYT